MSDANGTISELLTALFGGAVTTVIAATAGRLMYHAQEVRHARRKPFGKELFWEIPTVFAIALIAEATSSYFGFNGPISTGVAAVLAYLGPRGIELALLRWFDSKKEKP